MKKCVIDDSSCKRRRVRVILLTVNPICIFLSLIIILFLGSSFSGLCGITNSHTEPVKYYISPSGDDSNSGTSASSPFKTIEAANAIVKPGDTVFLRTGDYNDPIKPARSGQPGKYITYKAYGNEKPILTATKDPKIAIDLVSGIDYICVDGIYADGRGEHYFAYNSTIANWLVIGGSYNIVQNCNFRSALGWLGVEIKETGTYNKILNNRMDLIGTVNIAITNNNESKADLFSIHGDYNLVEGNHLSRGGHNIIGTTQTADYNVIRHNLIENDWGDGKRYRGFVPKGINLWEGNIITNCGYVEGQRTTMNVGTFQFDSPLGIVRRNIFMNNYAKGMNGGCSKNRLIQGLRVFHNVFFNQASSIFSLASWAEWCLENPATHNFFKNNIIYNDGSMTADPKFMDDAFIKFGGNAKIAENRFVANSFYEVGKEIMVALPNDFGTKSLVEMQDLAPDNFSDNIIEKPLFTKTNPTKPEDFQLLTGSPQIDKGAFLTVIVGTGKGKSMKVEDALYFCDGFGLIGGDRIQLEGQRIAAAVLNVDYETNTITLDRDLNWTSGQGVSFEYKGIRPDIGAHEYGLFNHVYKNAESK